MHIKTDAYEVWGDNITEEQAAAMAEEFKQSIILEEVVKPARAKALMAEHQRIREIGAKAEQTIYYMVSVLMSDDFWEWMVDNWDEVSKEKEYSEIMRLYLNDTDVYYTTVPVW